MFIAQLDQAMEVHRKQFSGKKSMNQLLMMPTKTKEDRFRLLLELLTFSAFLSYWKIYDPEKLDYEPIYLDIYTLLAHASMYINTPTIVSGKFTELISYLSAEFIKEIGDAADFSSIADVYVLKIGFIQFITRKTKLSSTDTSFVFKAKSGQAYSGTSLKDIVKLDQASLLDILEWLSYDIETEKTKYDIHQYMLTNKKDLMEKFKNLRVCYIAFINYLFAPEKRNEVIVFVLETLEIPHEYGPKSQSAVIAMNKKKYTDRKAKAAV